MNGSSVDLHEVDGASNRGIQEIRELKENIRFMPTSSRYKIIIIDEVHMLTSEAFNALLKTLEEPPDHVYFMFATTELHKVPVTILSRCQRYELKRVSHKELAAHFARLAAGEGVTIDEAALNMVVREAGGSVRDGLSLLDQVFSYCGDTVTGEEVVDVLGLVSHEVIGEIGNGLLSGDLATALEKLDAVYSYGMDIKRFINELLSWFRALVICRESKQPGQLLDLPAEELAVLQQAAGHYSSQSLLQMFNLLMDGLEKVTFSAQPRFALEMVFINAVQLGDVVPVTELLGRLDDVLTGVVLPQAGDQVPVQPAAQTAQQTVPPGNKKNSENSTVVARPAAVVIHDERNPPLRGDVQPEQPKEEQPDPRSEPEKKALVSQPPVAEPVQAVQSGAVQKGAPRSVTEQGKAESEKKDRELAAEKDIRRDWPVFIKYVRERLPWMAATLQLAVSAKLKDGKLLIKYDDTSYCRVLKNKENILPLTEFAADFFQENLQVQFQIPDASGCETDPDSGVAVQRERRALANDPLVMTALDIFNGHVGNIRVGPRFRKALSGEPADEESRSDRQQQDG
jgi:DNA polymerase-3 subunit gamma/tau